MEEGKDDDKYTQDGTVDIHGKPAVKRNTGRWKACPYILANECCERLAYYGMSTNLVTYMQEFLNQGNVAAANSVTNWAGTCYITPLLGAFLADAYLGRFWTIATFMVVYITGLTLLTLAASVKGIKPSCHEHICHPNSAQKAAAFMALYLIALGTGGIKPCVSSFGADQFDESDSSEKKSKSSFFNWFYLSINIGALVASTLLVYVQTYVGWSWGFGIPAAVMAVAVVSFFLGSPLYRHQKPGGSPLTRIAQVVVASIRKSGIRVPDDKSQLFEVTEKESAIQGSRKLEHTDKFMFFDKAAVQTENDRASTGNPNPWRLCTVTQVEELKSIIRILPIWATGVVIATVYSQMGTMFVLQGKRMDPTMGTYKIPAATLSMVDTLSVIMWVPIYDRLIVPTARKFTGHERGFTQLTRMGIGLVISIFAMLAAGIVEVIRLNIVKRDNLYNSTDFVPISIFWQVPQYFIVGTAEVFTFIGQLEFFYDQAPDAVRSMSSALSLTTAALGGYVSTLLVTMVTVITTQNGKKTGWIPDNLNDGHLDYFFWLLAVLSLVNFGVYLLIAKRYTFPFPFLEEEMEWFGLILGSIKSSSSTAHQINQTVITNHHIRLHPFSPAFHQTPQLQPPPPHSSTASPLITVVVYISNPMRQQPNVPDCSKKRYSSLRLVVSTHAPDKNVVSFDTG